MGRGKGSFVFEQNFEILRAAPLDARQRVDFYTDLVDPAAWISVDGYAWLYNGAIVAVTSDPSSGVYWLKDAANYTDYSSWISLSGGGTIDPSALQDLYSYIDGSLALRDASINELYELYETSLGFLNVGDASAGVYAGYDASGNVQLRTFLGSSGTTVTQVGDNIVIGIDASYSGESNYGENVGIGDASIYVQKLGDALQFREIKAGSSQITVDVSNNLILIDASIDVPSPSGDGIDGGVWITDITPTSGGNVGDKVYSSDGNVLDSCLTDTSTLTVHVLALPGHTNYKPVVSINSSPVSISANPDKPLWEGTYNIQYNFADASITVLHEDGANWSTTVDADTPAVIQSANFIGTYPGSQTELKAGDTMQINVVTDVAISSIVWDNTGALTSGSYVASGTNNTFTVTIADRGNTTQTLGFTLRAIKSTGSTSLDYVSTVHGTVELTDVVKLNDVYPTFSFTSVSYPATQGAIKTGESATMNHTVSDYTTLAYSSPTGELTITSPSTYQSAKNTTYLSGGYNITTNNFRIVANRSANNASATGNSIVWIANTPATLVVSEPAARLRSGGNNGTSIQNHTITINASGQRLLSAPDVTKDTGGTWSGSFSWSSSATTFTRTLQVHDNDSKATYNWTNATGTNLAGIVTTVASPGTYTLGGFVIRTIAVAAFGWQSNINVQVSDYTKLSSSGSGQSLNWAVIMGTRSTIGDVLQGQAGKWSASGTFANPTTINILDKSATDSQSQATSFTIQEGI